MEPRRLALLVPDGFTRSGIEGLINDSRPAHYKLLFYKSFQDFVKQAGSADILLMDASGLKLKEIEARLLRLASCCGQVRVLVISDQLKVQHIKHIMQLGAKGFIYRDDLSEVLVNNIDLVARDVVTMSPQALQLLTSADQLYVANDLKPIDIKVLRLTSQGLTVKAIAAELEISTHSVYRTRDKLREVLDVPTIEKLLHASRDYWIATETHIDN